MTERLSPGTVAERISERCVNLEKQIGETAAAIADLNEKRAKAESKEIITLAAQIEYAERAKLALRRQREDLEPARLKEVADDAGRVYADAAQRFSAVVSEFSTLERKIAELEPEVSRRQVESQEAFRAKHAAEATVRLFSSNSAADRTRLQTHMAELRGRLESLGSTS
jgi:chromosome segregation ATPase